ncbi:MAG: FG-GAP repeat protein [Candidatus Peregrinibacteria bacterium]|nr:FG-GAP repeat protein [Candidatus Peregrinibacteria bacterium]
MALALATLLLLSQTAYAATTPANVTVSYGADDTAEITWDDSGAGTYLLYESPHPTQPVYSEPVTSPHTVDLSSSSATYLWLSADDGSSESDPYAFCLRSSGIGNKVVACDAARWDNFAKAVAIDGDLAIVGAEGDDDSGSRSGSAYIFRKAGSFWVQEAKLVASDGAYSDYFGGAVDIDGNRAIVGADYNDDDGSNSGSAYVFAYDGSEWSQEAKLTASDGARYDNFGFSVSISGDRAVVGSRYDDDGFGSSGSAYVFAFDGNSWFEEAKFVGSSYNAQLGSSVAISGSRIVAGAPSENSRRGAAYVFAHDGTSWSQEETLLSSSPQTYYYFGTSVDISGSRIVVGEPSASSRRGAAYVFDHNGSSWTSQARLTASDGYYSDYLGQAVAVEGDVVLAGAYRDDDAGSSSGSTYVFAPNGSSWAQVNKLVAPDGHGSQYFAYSLGLGGGSAIVGAYNDRGEGSGAGAAYMYGSESTPPVVALDHYTNGGADADGDSFTESGSLFFSCIDASGCSELFYSINGGAEQTALCSGGTCEVTLLPPTSFNISFSATDGSLTGNRSATQTESLPAGIGGTDQCPGQYGHTDGCDVTAPVVTLSYFDADGDGFDDSAKWNCEDVETGCAIVEVEMAGSDKLGAHAAFTGGAQCATADCTDVVIDLGGLQTIDFIHMEAVDYADNDFEYWNEPDDGFILVLPDYCPTTPGAAAGCPYGNEVQVDLNVHDDAAFDVCSDGSKTCKEPYEFAVVKLLDVTDPDFIATYGADSSQWNSKIIFESPLDIGVTGWCMTDAEGRCSVGTADVPNDTMVVSGVSFDSFDYWGTPLFELAGYTKKVVAAAEYSDSKNEVTSNGFTGHQVFKKNQHVLHTSSKDNSAEFIPAKDEEIDGVLVIEPSAPVWNEDLQRDVYNFFLLSDSRVRVNVCEYAGSDYQLLGYYYPDGSFRYTSYCWQYVEEVSVFAFDKVTP